MKIIADENIPMVEEFFGHMGEVICKPGRQMMSVDLGDADVLLVRSVTRVDERLLGRSKVAFVGTCTIGVDHLDLDYLTDRKITYASSPGCNANSVVEYVYAALCNLDVNWLTQRVGIIGCGNVGGLLYRRLRAQGVECLCYDPFLTPSQNPDLASLEEVLACDVISLHTPLTTTGPFPTYHLLGAAELGSLKQNAVLLNCGRGPVIDNQALLDIVLARKDLRIVLDVWEPEPDISRDLLTHIAIGTPHIAGYSYDGKVKGTEMIYQALCRYFQLIPQKSLRQLVPPLDQNKLQLSEGDDWSVTKRLIQQVYDIAADDRALRALAGDTLDDSQAFARGFDALRKFYPVRREFHNYQIDTSSTSSDNLILPKLKALGFTVS